MSDSYISWSAYFALLFWPVVALYLYSKLPVGQATLWTILAGYLLLPIGADIKFKMVPAFNKQSIPNLAALIGCVLYARRLPKLFHGFGLVEFLIVTILISPFITGMLNNDPIQAGSTVLPGVGPYDAGSAAIAELIFILPFFLGRQFLRSAKDNTDVLRVMVIAGLAYSLLILIEVRMSPQLRTWFYGQVGGANAQEFREGNFRAVVFLANGLLVAFFAMTTTVAAAALWRTKTRIGRLPSAGITAYLSVILVLCKTMGAFVYGAVLVPLVRWASPRLQIRVACVFVIIALAYPTLRAENIFPTNYLVNAAAAIDTDRADSLKSRFDWEDRLLDHALQRAWFGWGRYARSRLIFAETGEDRSITDGYWIITMGQYGIVGFVAQFGLLGLAVFRAAMALKFARTMEECVCLAALTLIVAINIADLLPNASMTAWLWLLVGTLLGRAEMLSAVARQRNPAGNLKPPSMGVHSRVGRQA